MEMDEGYQEETGETPPPLDDSWWAAVMQDENQLKATGQHRSGNSDV